MLDWTLVLRKPASASLTATATPVREVKVNTEPAAIRSALEDSADRLARIGVEASSLGIWLYRELQPQGLPIIVVEARHMRVSLSTMRNKTDRNDARGIAQMMRLGWYRAVHVKNIDMQKMRTLLANRKLLKRKLIDIENHIRGSLRAYGLLIGTVARGRFEANHVDADRRFCRYVEGHQSPDDGRHHHSYHHRTLLHLFCLQPVVAPG
jgi:transposase